MTTKSKPATTPAETASAKSASPPRRALIIAGVVAGVWILGLVILAIATANPVTLNPKQILQSDYVVTAKRTNAAADTLEVSKEWKHGELSGTIKITNLGEIAMPSETEFLVPLKKSKSGRFLITKTMLPNEAPLIYPATPEAESQLIRLLKPGAE